MTHRRDAQHEVRALAYRQAGFFTAAQALQIGFSYQAQKYHVDHGNWRRAERGIFRLRDWPATVEDTYVLWSLWSGGRGVVSHESALAIHDLGVLDPAHVHLTVPPGFRAQHPAVITTTTSLDDGDVEDRGAFRVTTPSRTLLDLAASTAGQEGVDEAVAEAVERGLTTSRALRHRSDDFGDRAALRIERALNRVAP